MTHGRLCMQLNAPWFTPASPVQVKQMVQSENNTLFLSWVAASHREQKFDDLRYISWQCCLFRGLRGNPVTPKLGHVLVLGPHGRTARQELLAWKLPHPHCKAGCTTGNSLASHSISSLGKASARLFLGRPPAFRNELPIPHCPMQRDLQKYGHLSLCPGLAMTVRRMVASMTRVIWGIHDALFYCSRLDLSAARMKICLR